MTWAGAHRAPFRGALVRAARERTAGLSSPYTRRRADASDLPNPALRPRTGSRFDAPRREVRTELGRRVVGVEVESSPPRSSWTASPNSRARSRLACDTSGHRGRRGLYSPLSRQVRRVGSPLRPPERRSSQSLIPRAASLVESAPMAERTKRRKGKSAGSRKATKRARPKSRVARGKAAKPRKKKTVGKRKVAVATRTRPSPRRPAKATAPAPGPEAQAPPAGKRPEVTPSTETVKSSGEPGQTPA